jgi:hypothetical protein
MMIPALALEAAATNAEAISNCPHVVESAKIFHSLKNSRNSAIHQL